MAVLSVSAPGAPARHLRTWRRRSLRERRRLSSPSATNSIQLFLQAFVFTFQALATALRFLKFATQAIDFAIEVSEARWLLGLRRVVGAVAHAPVMPESARQYKRAPANLGAASERQP